MYLPEGFRVEPHASGKPHCKEVIFPDGRKFFLKYPHYNDDLQVQLIELYNELFCDILLQICGVNGLNASPKVIDFKLGVLMNYFELDWSVTIDNPTAEIVNQSKMPACFVVDILVGQADRGPQAYHHIGVKQIEESKFIVCPIDNGHCLGGHQKDRPLPAEITLESVNGLFWSQQRMDWFRLERESNRLKEIPVASLGDEVVRRLVLEGGLSAGLSGSLTAYSREVVDLLVRRQEQLPIVVSRWLEGKMLQVETSSEEAGVLPSA